MISVISHHIRFALLTGLLLVCSFPLHAQRTVADLFQTKQELANEYFKEDNFVKALSLFEDLHQRRQSSDVSIKIGVCHYQMKRYKKAATIFDNVPPEDFDSTSLFFYAEALLSTGRHNDAERVYRQLFQQTLRDTVLLKKIWQINNLSTLLEDSLHVALSPLPINTAHSDIAAIPFNSGILFASNREQLKLIRREDARMNAGFYKFYLSRIKEDTSITNGFVYDIPQPFNHQLTQMHAGPITIDRKLQRAMITTTNDLGSRNRLALQFIEKRNERWEKVQSFPWNSDDYSCMHPSISDDGQRMYFVSDMPGGFGGWDIYYSDFADGAWTQPVNCGSSVNTRYDELFPYIHHSGMLYFSSNGHAGMGGLDIFKTDLSHMTTDVLNIGYPLNSSGDDFGFYVDSLQTHGFLSSNRVNGGFDDDIFEFDIDLQVYPLVISGQAKMKEHGWKDSTELVILGNAEIEVIDHIREKLVFKTTSAPDGSFSISIPYFSKYRVRVVVNGETQGIISLHIPKHKKTISDHEIVIVKDVFK